MLKYVFVTHFNEDAKTVLAIYQGSKPELDGLIETESEVPVFEDMPGFDAVLRIDITTNKFYYDYMRRETFESKITALGQENTELKQAVAELSLVLSTVMGGGE